MPMLNMRFVLPDHIIDLNRVESLSYIREKDGWLEVPLPDGRSGTVDVRLTDPHGHAVTRTVQLSRSP